MVGHHQNGLEENKIKNVVRIARNIMIHAALKWPDASEKSLWTMDMAHSVHLHNHNPHISIFMSLEEVWTRLKSSHIALHNSHTYVFPAYFLEPRLKNGNKLPRWMPRSRRAQYLGASPMYVSTVSLVRNLQTGNIRPQFNLVFDEYFETVHAREDQ